jgi:hypothetical protein
MKSYDKGFVSSLVNGNVKVLISWNLKSMPNEMYEFPKN